MMRLLIPHRQGFYWKVIVILILAIVAYVFFAHWSTQLSKLLPPTAPTFLRERLKHQYLSYIQNNVVYVVNGLGTQLAVLPSQHLEMLEDSDVNAAGAVVISSQNLAYSGDGIEFRIILYPSMTSHSPSVLYSFIGNHGATPLKRVRFSPDGQRIAFFNEWTSQVHIIPISSEKSATAMYLPHGIPVGIQWVNNHDLAIEIATPGHREKLNGFANIDTGTETITYPCNKESALEIQSLSEICPESPERTALMGTKDHPVENPVFSPDGRLYFALQKKEDLLYKEWIEGYDLQTKKSFLVTLVYWRLPGIP